MAKKNFFVRGLETVGDVSGNVVTGMLKGVEGIADFSIGLVGGIGGAFDKDFRDDVQDVVAFDATHEWVGKHFDNWTEDSYTNNSEVGSTVEDVASFIGQILPAVVVTVATSGAGAPAAIGSIVNTVASGVSAAGNATEEAYNDDAEYYRGLGYGTVTGAIEAGTNALFGGSTGNVLGKGVSSLGKEVAEQGAKRVIKDAAEEGLEELVAHGANPLAKTIYKGKDALKEYGTKEYWKDAGKVFVVGAGGGALYGETLGRAVNKTRGLNDDIGAAVEANERIKRDITRRESRGYLSADAENAASASRNANLKSIEKVLKRANEIDRARYIQNYGLSDDFNADGTLKEHSSENASALDKRYYSASARGNEARILSDLADMSNGTEQIRAFSGELSESAEKNFIKMKKALSALNERRGEDVSFVIVEPNNSFNGTVRRGDTVYIAADTLEHDTTQASTSEADGGYAGTLIHEYAHTTEGTSENVELNTFLGEDSELFARAASKIFSTPEYQISLNEIDNIQQKKDNGEELSNIERQKYNTFRREVNATMAEYYLGNEEFIHRLVMEDASLAERIIDGFKNMRKAISRLSDSEARAAHKRLRRAEDLYLKAAKAAGNKHLQRLLLSDRDDDEDSNEHISENMKVSDLDTDSEIRYNLKGRNYTDQEYRDFGWARANDVLTARENERLRSLFADAVSGQSNPPKTKSGEYMIAVGEDVDNKIAYMRGDIDRPVITRILEIDEYNETELDEKRRNVYEAERRGIQPQTSGIFRFNYSTDYRYGWYQQGSRAKSQRNNNKLGIDRGGSRKTASRIKEIIFGDDGQEISRSFKFSYKSPAESKVYQRTAEWEKLKVYEKADAEKMISTILYDVMPLSYEDTAVMTQKSRKETVKLLWAKLNQALTDKELHKAADDVADYVISQSVVKSYINDPAELSEIERAESALSYLKPLLRRLRLGNLKSEIKHRFDKSASGIMLMWGTNKTGIGVDEIVTELNSEIKGYGFPIDPAASEADIFFAIHDAYTAARADVKKAYEAYRDRILDADERAKLHSDISAQILKMYETEGRDSQLAQATRLFRAELWKADQRVEYMKQNNKLIAKVDAFRDLTMGRFENANTYHPDLFAGSVEQLKKIVRGGVISVKGTRSAAGLLAQWYTQDNQLVKDVYDPAIKEKLEQVADRGLTDYAGKRLDHKALLEPYMHRIDLSGIREQLKAIYGEENRSILATWKAKSGEPSVTLSEVAAELEAQGLRIVGDDFELFTQIHQIYADAVGPLTVEDLRNLTDVVAYFTKFVKNFNKVYNGKKYVDAEPIAKKHIEAIRKNKNIKLGHFKKLLTGRYAQTFMRPETLAKRMDMYSEGFYTEQLESFRRGLIEANDHEYEMMKAVADFDKKNKKYFSELSKRRIEYKGKQIPADIALSLYMTSKRRQAQAGLATSGFKYEDGKNTVEVEGFMPQKVPDGVELGAERMQKLLYEEFSKEDKEFISIVEKIFNEQCKTLKHDTDMQTKGYSNTVDGYYYPIRRAFVAKSVDSDFEDLMGRASNKSFNKDTVEGARGILCIMPLTEVLSRHVRGVSQYSSLATVIRNYDTLFNLDIGDDANNPTSIAREGEKIWKEGSDYYKKLLADMQGIGKKQSAFLSVIRGSYATYQLGGNPKTWVTQLSSFLASTSVLDFNNVVAGIGIDGSDVDEYCTLAKLRNANNDAVLAQANANRPGLLAKRSKVGEASQKVSNALMAPIGAVDRFVVKKLFGACQVQIAKRGGAKIGTKENKTEAGKLLERVILQTQQNSLATERSAAMRSDNEIFKSLTMFSADGMNVFGQLIDSMGEITVFKARLRAADEASAPAIKKAIASANKRAAKATFALASSAAFMAMISLAFNYLYHRIDDEDKPEDIAGDVVANFIGNMLGGLPVWRDIYSYLTDGYEVNNYMYSVLNDMLDAVSSCLGIVDDIKNDSFDKRKAAQAARKALYSAGQLLGIPTRNLHNVVYSILGFIPSVKYNIDNMFYEQAYNADLKKAVDAGDEQAVATIAGIMTGERVGDIESDKAREELNRLTLSGFSVLPRAIADSVTVGEEKIELSNTQKKQIKQIYSIANESVTELMELEQYAAASDEIRAKAIKTIYDIYYDLALGDVIAGANVNDKNVLFAEAIEIERLALILATARTLEADKDANGNPISGSKKKKIENYVQSLNLTAAQKYMVMGYLGYRNKNGESTVRAYITRLNLTTEEATALLKYSGYK